MKKKIIFFTAFCIFFLLLCSNSSFAMFTKKKYEIDATLLENGDMHVEETITYATDENKNGVTRTIKLKNPNNTKNSADDFELEEVLVNYITCSEVTYGKNGDNYVYEYEYDGDEAYIKLYTPFKTYDRTNKVVKYIYTLKNVAVKYNDIAELYWNFVGNESTDGTEDLIINITLPFESAQDTIYVYGHGSDNGTFEKSYNNITLNVKDVKEGQAIDARILFSRDAVQTSKIVNKSVLQNYRNIEEGMSNKLIIFGIEAYKIAVFFIIIILIASVVIYVLYHKRHKKVEGYIRELPYGLEPEILQYVYYGEFKNNTLWITFLNLIRKGVFTIEKITNEVGRETQNIIYNENVSNLPEYEAKAVDLITNCMSTVDKNGKQYIELEKLKKKFKTNQVYRDYKKFSESIETEVDSIFGEDKKPKVLKIIMVILMALFILLLSVFSAKVDSAGAMGVGMFFGVTTIIYGSLFISFKKPTLFTIIFIAIHAGIFQIANITLLSISRMTIFYIPYILLFILMVYCFKIKKETAEKQEARAQIDALKRYIQDYSMLHEKGLEDIVLWGEYLIMAIALGLNKNTINYFYDGCIQSPENNLGSNLIIVGSYNDFSRGFSNTFTSIPSVSSSSSGIYSGSSGGFSGGGGSGGGGRRWRRNRFVLKSM